MEHKREHQISNETENEINSTANENEHQIRSTYMEQKMKRTLN